MPMAAAGMVWLTRIALLSSYVTAVLLPTMIIGIGLGQIIAPSINTGAFGVATSDAGVASATVNTGQQLGGSVRTARLKTIAPSPPARTIASPTNPTTEVHLRA